MPETISTVFESTKPVADAARPGNAFRSEITTGMAAPPTGRTNRTPERSEGGNRSAITHEPRRPADAAPPNPDAAGTQRPLSAGGAGETGSVAGVWPRKQARPSADQLLQLVLCQEEAGKRDRADQRREHDRAPLGAADAARLRREPVELRQGDERRSPTADPV